MLAPNPDIQSVLRIEASRSRFALLKRPFFRVIVAVAVAGVSVFLWFERSSGTTIAYTTAPVTAANGLPSPSCSPQRSASSSAFSRAGVRPT